jgi:hypothetical protein
VTERASTTGFCLRLRAVLQTVDVDTAGTLFAEARRICRELEQYRSGAQTRTIDAAEQVARLDRELAHLAIDERNAAIMARVTVKRSKLYELRKLARRPV